MEKVNRWIFGKPSLDLAFLYAGGVAAFLFVWTVTPASTGIWAWVGLASLAAIDTGHMYTTIWRTHLRREEFLSTPLYWAFPLAVFLVSLVWIVSRLPYLLTVILYLTIYHHMRQYYGVVRWYEKLNARYCRPTHFFIHALFLLPLLAAHFRESGVKHIFNTGDLLLYPDPVYFGIVTGMYLVVLTLWAGFEARLWARGVREPNRLLAVAVPMTFAGVGCFFGKNTMQIILPLVLTHGIGYFALLGLSLHRLEPKRYRTFLLPTALVALSAGVMGYFVLWAEENYLDADYSTIALSFNDACLMALLLVPTVSHYMFDAWIWTGKHREARKVFSLPKSAWKPGVDAVRRAS